MRSSCNRHAGITAQGYASRVATLGTWSAHGRHRAIPNAGPARLSTVGDLHQHVLKYTPSNWPRPVTGRLPDSLWEYVVDVVQYETGLPQERLTRGARFVQDLGLH